MNTPSIGSINAPKPPESYEPMLKESIDHFLTQYQKGCSDFSGFGSIFFRLLQTMADPPLEIIWFYSAVTFHSSKPVTLSDPLKKKLLVAKDLFQLLVSCSSTCNGLKRVAVLAPIVYELYNLVLDCSKKDLCFKREIDSLVEWVVNYISLCCSNYSEEEEDGLDNLTASFVDSIRVWTVDRAGEKCEFGDDLKVFFPLVSYEVQQKVGAGCGVNFLAGVVMNQAFLLRLCLKFGSEVSREESWKDMQNWAFQTIVGFRSCRFFDILLQMLLEPSLPVTTLLGSEEEILLRKLLYDAVILVEYAFLKSEGCCTQLSGNHLKNLALTWSLVADNAMQFVREIRDDTRAISYMNAFSESRLPKQIIKWVINQTGKDGEMSRPNISTPKACINWLLVLEGQGVKVFDHNVSMVRANCKSRVDYQLPKFRPDFKNQNESIFGIENEERGDNKVDDQDESIFGIENEERGDNKVDDQEMVDSANDAFLSATKGIRKREEGTTDEEETRVKLVKYNFHENYIGEKLLTLSDDDSSTRESDIENLVHGSSSGSDMENFVFDEEMEDMGR